MKKIFYFIAVGLGLCSMVACGPSKAEKEAAAREDSIRVADSLARVEAERIEKARLDSIEQARQDSIAKIEDFESKIPSFTRLYNLGDDSSVKSYLTSLGFKRSEKTKHFNEDGYGDMEETTITYKLTLDSQHYCIYQNSHGWEWNNSSLTIVGCPEKMEQAKSEAAAMRRQNPDDENCGIDIKSNKIEWGCGA